MTAKGRGVFVGTRGADDACRLSIGRHIRSISLTFNENGAALLRKAELEVGEEVADFFAATAADGAHPVAVAPGAERQGKLQVVGTDCCDSCGLADIEIVAAVKKFDAYMAAVEVKLARAGHDDGGALGAGIRAVAGKRAVTGSAMVFGRV